MDEDMIWVVYLIYREGRILYFLVFLLICYIILFSFDSDFFIGCFMYILFFGFLSILFVYVLDVIFKEF